MSVSVKLSLHPGKRLAMQMSAIKKLFNLTEEGFTFKISFQSGHTEENYYEAVRIDAYHNEKFISVLIDPTRTDKFLFAMNQIEKTFKKQNPRS